MPRPKIRTIAAAAGLLLAGLATVAAARAPAYPASYAADRAEIEDLMARYLFAIDYQDWDAYVATFTEDGELDFARSTSKGRAAIREALLKFQPRIAEVYHTESGKPPKLRHVILQSAIRVEGDRAWARSLWLEMANHGPGDTMKMGTYGTYEDELRKVDGHWLFAKRRILNEFLEGRTSGPKNPVRAMDEAAEASASPAIAGDQP